MGTRARFVAIAVVLTMGGLLAALAGRGGGDTPAPAASGAATLSGNCLQKPAEIATPSWYPDDLPMPAGSYASQLPEATRGLRRVVFAVKGSLRDFVVYALGEWPKHGWTLGRGEAEPGEAEDNFLQGDRYGIFRAQSIFCDQGMTWVLMVLNDPSVPNVPTPGFNTLNPSASPSPLTS